MKKELLLVCLACFIIGCEPQPAEMPFKAELNLHDTMSYILDPAADVIWDSAGTVITEAGHQDLAPTTDEGWDRVRNNAAVVIETSNLLMMPGRAIDEDNWMEISKGLMVAGKRAMAAAEAHDGDALFDAGGHLYRVCLSCHQSYNSALSAE